MAGKGAEPKPDLTPEERQAVFGLLQRGTYRGSGLRAAAALVSSLRGADKALTDRAKAKRSVSPRWVKRQLAKCGIDASAALMGIAQRRAKVRRTEPEASHSATRTTRSGYSGESVWAKSLLNGHVHAFGVDGVCRCGAKPFGNSATERTSTGPETPPTPADQVVSE